MALPSPAVISASANTTTSGAITAALTHDSASLWCITGFEINYGGATAGSIQMATLSGLLGGTQSFAVPVPTGATVGGVPIDIEWTEPLWSVDKNTDVVLSLPALGAGNGGASINLHGFKVGVNKVI